MTALSHRAASAEDVPVLLAMMGRFNALEAIEWTAEAGEPALRTLLGDASLGAVGLLTEDERTVGYFVVTWGYDLEWNGRDAFLTEIFLEEHARGRGFGARALALAEETARAAGARALHLMVRHDNERAKQLYVRAGYTSPPRLFLSKPLSSG